MHEGIDPKSECNVVTFLTDYHPHSHHHFARISSVQAINVSVKATIEDVIKDQTLDIEERDHRRITKTCLVLFVFRVYFDLCTCARWVTRKCLTRVVRLDAAEPLQLLRLYAHLLAKANFANSTANERRPVRVHRLVYGCSA